MTHSAVINATFSFTGQVQEIQTGLYYYKTRFYSPDIGRFLQPDPIGYDLQAFTSCDCSCDFECIGPDLSQLNLYQYALNDPVNATDPLGTQAVVEYKPPIIIADNPPQKSPVKCPNTGSPSGTPTESPSQSPQQTPTLPLGESVNFFKHPKQWWRLLNTPVTVPPNWKELANEYLKNHIPPNKWPAGVWAGMYYQNAESPQGRAVERGGESISENQQRMVE